MRKHVLSLAVILSLLITVGFTTSSRAEYVGAYLGLVSPHDSDLTSTIFGMGIFTGEFGFDTGITLGGKIGKLVPIPDTPCFWGAELDINYQSFNFESVTLLGTSASVQGDVSALFATGNLLVGYYGEAFRPYAGIGLGLASAEASIDFIGGVPIIDGTEDDTALSWQLLLGADFTINPMVSFFAEYRYAGANFEFVFPGEIDEVDYRTSLLYGGIKFNF